MSDGVYLKELGGRIKALRMSKGISVRKLGELCSTDYANLSRFENGQVNPHILLLRNIAHALQVDLKDII